MTFTQLLNDTITIQTVSSSQNEYGEWVEGQWVDSSTESCRMSPISDSLKVLEAGEYEDVKYKCFVTSESKVTYDNRIKHDGDIYNIRSIKEDSMNHHKEILLSHKI